MEFALAGVAATIVAFRIIAMTTGRQAAEPLDRTKFLGYLGIMIVLFAFCVVRGFFALSGSAARNPKDRLVELTRKSNALLLAGHESDASAAAGEALSLAEQTFGAEDQRVFPFLGRYASLLSREKKYPEAETLTRRAMAMAIKQFGENHETVALQENNLGTILADTGRLDQAEALYRRALAKTERMTGQVPPALPAALENLAALCERTGRTEEAERLKERAQAYRPKR